MRNNVSIVVPAFNEEAYLETTLWTLKNEDWYEQLIVVNDGSTDSTGEICDKYGDKIIHFTKNQGKSKALQAGWKLAEGNIILCLDADLGETVTEAGKLLLPFHNSSIDAVIGVLPTQSKRGFGLVKKRAQQLIYKKTKHWIKAPLSGQRAFRRKFLPLLLSKHYHGFGVETAMTIDLLRQGATIVEVDVEMRHRQTGKSLKGFLHRGRQWLELEKTTWRV